MKTWLSPPSREFNGGEFCLVIALAFGLVLLVSIVAAIDYKNQPVKFDDADLIWTVFYELIVGAVVAAVLRSREWKLADFEIHPSQGSTVIGLLLGGVILLVWMAIELVMGKIPNDVDVTLPWTIAVSIVNPVFEEVLVLGYVVQAMRKRFGLAIAMNVSIAIRLTYHLYQGPLAVIPIAAMGVIVTLWYVRMGRLWPVIVAHVLLDFVALAGVVD